MSQVRREAPEEPELRQAIKQVLLTEPELRFGMKITVKPAADFPTVNRFPCGGFTWGRPRADGHPQAGPREARGQI
jgi:hypothetical protein